MSGINTSWGAQEQNERIISALAWLIVVIMLFYAFVFIYKKVSTPVDDPYALATPTVTPTVPPTTATVRTPTFNVTKKPTPTKRVTKKPVATYRVTMPPEPTKPTLAPVPTIKPPTERRFTIKLGSFNDEAQAMIAARTIRELEHYRFNPVRDEAAGTVSLHVGKFEETRDALVAMAALKAGHPKLAATIVPLSDREATPKPTKRPTVRPTRRPTRRPTVRPTVAPTRRPTRRPTVRPTRRPTRRPTVRPTPTRKPTPILTRRPPVVTKKPTPKPTIVASVRPTSPPIPTRRPTRRPIATKRPTWKPIVTRKPTPKPTWPPAATKRPTRRPTWPPVATRRPTRRPTVIPTRVATRTPMVDDGSLGPVPPPGYSVQVGSFSQRQNAVNFRRVLERAGFRSYVVRAFNQGKDWYRVQLGAYANSGQAEKVLAEFEKKYNMPSIIVRRR